MNFTQFLTWLMVSSTTFILVLSLPTNGSKIRISLVPTLGLSSSCPSRAPEDEYDLPDESPVSVQRVSEPVYFVGMSSFELNQGNNKSVESSWCVDPSHLSPLIVRLGNNSIFYEASFIDTKQYRTTGMSTLLLAGNRTMTLNRMCVWNDANKMDIFLLTSKKSFPFNDETFMEFLRKEVVTEYLNLSTEYCTTSHGQRPAVWSAFIIAIVGLWLIFLKK